MKKLLDIYLYISLTAILVFAGYWIYCLTWPYNIVTFTEQSHTNKMIYKVGEEMDYTVHYCKHIEIAGKVYPELTDGLVYGLKPTVSNAPVGCGEKIMSLGKTPDVPTGKYYIRVRAVYQVNPFREITVEYQTNEFEIIGERF